MLPFHRRFDLLHNLLALFVKNPTGQLLTTWHQTARYPFLEEVAPVRMLCDPPCDIARYHQKAKNTSPSAGECKAVLRR